MYQYISSCSHVTLNSHHNVFSLFFWQGEMPSLSKLSAATDLYSRVLYETNTETAIAVISHIVTL